MCWWREAHREEHDNGGVEGGTTPASSDLGVMGVRSEGEVLGLAQAQNMHGPLGWAKSW